METLHNAEDEPLCQDVFDFAFEEQVRYYEVGENMFIIERFIRSVYTTHTALLSTAQHTDTLTH